LNSNTRTLLIVICFFISVSLFAAQITGNITNGTTGKPAANVEVMLLSLSRGMETTGSTRTDNQGRFTLNVPDEGVQHLIRVSYQGANYHKAAPQGTTSVEITIYDAVKHVDNLIGEGRILRVQTVGGELEVSETYILRNESSPPRTQMSDRSFEIALPEGAQIADAMARGPGGMPVANGPVPTEKKDHYAFVFPIRPGETQFQVTYKLPYQGSHDFAITTDMPLAELGVMLPKTMTFKSAGIGFTPATDEAGMTVFVAKSVSAGQQLKFTISGEGSAPRQTEGGGPAATPNAADSGTQSTPATGDTLSLVSLYMICGVVLIIFGGAFLALRKRKSTVDVPAAAAGAKKPRASSRLEAVEKRPVQKTSSPNNMLDALKDELFQLESDHVQGKITRQEYEKSKTGIETLIRRQLG
jgi:5-hydroxyisourate hydrolase-like protein (transthyretin family)